MGKKKDKITQDKSFIAYKCFYSDCNIIELKTGEFVKMYEITESDWSLSWAGYNTSLKLLIGEPEIENILSYQFFCWKEKRYVLFRVKADVVDDVVSVFEHIVETYYENVPEFVLKEVNLTEWFDIMYHLVHFKGLDRELILDGKKSRSMKEDIQPFNRKVKLDHLEIGVDGKQIQTMVITNFPSSVFNGLLTELLSISENIYTSLYLKKVNVEHCKKALELDKEIFETKREILRAYLENVIQKNQILYQTCLLVSVAGDEYEVNQTVKHLEDLVKKYMISVSTLEYQQPKAYLSNFPLCENLIHYNNVLDEDGVISLLGFSWIERLHSGATYGIFDLSGKQMSFNRLIEKNSGFYLGSDNEEVNKAIQTEIRQLCEHQPDLKVAVFTLSNLDISHVDLKGVQILGNDLDINRELLRAFVYLHCGVNGHVSKRIREVLFKVLSTDDNVKSYCDFLTAVARIDSDLCGQLEQSDVMTADGKCEECNGVKVYTSSESSYEGRLLQIMSGITACKADIIYILCADEIAKLEGNKFLTKLLGRKDKIFNLSGKTDMIFYNNPIVKDLIRNAEFIRIFKCNTLDRINVANLLGLNKVQKNYISDGITDGVHNLLITKYVDYMLEFREGEYE